ncbi:acetylornithine deacetylase (ArgE) [Thioclava sp. SK-1]|uniref:acetylornithine deacetylase n=1 Tax=Thioclava sp. SK-1 TaxID=1889770 RepID=UPI000826DF98|nr:acetylornithine deacetylase [Thioclava sp. SK-1]OCX65385.1 acetylornithine deacetylase (ArgE) [Thioclava sp. SK-1]
MTHLQWLAALIAHPTISADSNLALIAKLRAALETAGAICEVFPDTTGQKAALLARLGPDRPGGLLLSAHLDVVPIAGQQWTRPPFKLTQDGDRLYGRGTTDMKGFVACVMTLTQSLQIAQLKTPLWIAFSYDEEVGCAGVGDLLEALRSRKIRPDLVLVGEPTSLRIGLGHKGKIGYRADCSGIARHSAEAPLAMNALHLATDLVMSLRGLQAELAADGVREGGYSVPYATVHTGVLAGGEAVNIVPARAYLLFETRFPASESRSKLDNRIRAMTFQISNAATQRFDDTGITLTETLSYPGLSQDPDVDAVITLAGCLPEGTDTCRLSFGTEGGLFQAALDVPVIICGPGDMAQGHQPDEFIELAELEKCNALLRRAVTAFCGPVAASPDQAAAAS